MDALSIWDMGSGSDISKKLISLLQENHHQARELSIYLARLQNTAYAKNKSIGTLVAGLFLVVRGSSCLLQRNKVLNQHFKALTGLLKC